MIQAFDYKEPYLIQDIPGVNTESESLKYSHVTRLVPQFGDGLGPTNEVSLKAAVSTDDASNLRAWCESGNERGDNLVRQAFIARDKKVKQWQRNLRHEITSLVNEYQSTTDCVRLLLKTTEYLDRVSQISRQCLEIRTQIPSHDGPVDEVNKRIEEEITVSTSAVDDMKMLVEQLREYQRKQQDTRNCLLSDAEAKAMNLTVSKSCQHYEILLSFPYFPEDQHADQPINLEGEEKWEADVSRRVENSVSLRLASSDLCRKAENTVAANNSKLAAAWLKSNNALNEEIQRDEYQVYKVKQLLNQTLKDITSAEQRIASLRSDYVVQQRLKKLTAWRQQRIAYRPNPEHIKDAPIISLEAEAEHIEKRLALLEEDVKRTEQLFSDLTETKNHQLQQLSAISKKLYIDRDSCLGLRKSVMIDGTDGKFA